MAGETILVVDDEVKITDVVEYALRADGYAVVTAADGHAAWDRFQRHTPALVILDLKLPGLSGYDLLERMRAARPSVPVIMLTSRDAEADRVRGLSAGADDYVTKPFSPAELTARVRAVLRRCRAEGDGRRGDLLRVGPLVVDSEALSVTYFGQLLRLTHHEWVVLERLARRPHQVFTREGLIEAIYQGQGAVADRSVDALIKRLRAKLRAVRRKPDPIEAVYGLGYRLNPELSTTR